MDRRYRIYVIDDEHEILENYVELFKDEFDILTFDDPKKFIHSLNSEQKPDLVISDFKMPQMDGLQMIAAANDSGFYFPFILLSGYLDKESALQAVDHGVFRLLEKPVDYQALREVIDQLLIEFDITSVREEIQKLIQQLKEFYSGIRLIMDQHIPESVMNKLLIGPDSSAGKSDFNQTLQSLEDKLEDLLSSERVLTSMRPRQQYSKNRKG